MGAIKAIFRAMTGMVSIVVAKNNLFERAGERSYQAPLADAEPVKPPKTP